VAQSNNPPDTNPFSDAISAMLGQISDDLAAVFEGAISGIQLVVEALAAVPAIFVAIEEFIVGLPATIGIVFTAIETFIVGLPATISSVAAAIEGTIAGVFASIEAGIVLIGATAEAIELAIETGGVALIPILIGAIIVGIAAVVAAVVLAVPVALAAVASAFLGFVTGAVASIVGAGMAVKAAMGPFVDAFRPDVMARFKIIMDDLMASIGEMLVPLMQVANTIFRSIADAIASMTATMLPFIKQFAAEIQRLADAIMVGVNQLLKSGAIDAMMEMMVTLLTEFVDIGIALIPVFVKVVEIALLFVSLFAQIGTELLKLSSVLGPILMVAVTAAVDTLTYLARKIKEWMNDLLDFFGMAQLASDKERNGSSPGKSSQPAKFTSTDELWKDMMKSTFGAGRGETEKAKHIESAATSLALINGHVTKIVAWIEEKKVQAEAIDKAAGELARDINPINIMSKIASQVGDMWRTNTLRK